MLIYYLLCSLPGNKKKIEKGKEKVQKNSKNKPEKMGKDKLLRKNFFNFILIRKFANIVVLNNFTVISFTNYNDIKISLKLN